MKLNPGKHTPKLIGGAAVGCIVIAVVVSNIQSGKLRALEESYTGAGLQYIQVQEAQNLSDIKKAIDANKVNEEKEALDDRLAKIESGEIDLWSCFDDAVILGDSRGDDFEYNGFLPRSKILCEMGVSCPKALDYLDQVKETQPKHIIFTYGMNDVDGNFNSAEAFVSRYLEVLNTYREELPDSEIFVNSIIPVTQHAIDNDSNYANIPAYNEAMRQMCEENGYPFIDCDDLLEGHEDLFDADGQHFLPQAYPIWGMKIIRSIYEYESGANTEDQTASSAEVAEA